MAGKRIATTELNHENWDNEEAPEEMGEFKKASADQLKERLVITARRRISRNATSTDAGNVDAVKRESDSDSEAPTNAFSGFSGFQSTQSAAVASSSSAPFSFLSKIPAVTSTVTSGVKTEKKETTSDATVDTTVASTSSAGNANVNYTFDKSRSYYAKIKALNLSVLNWIKKHVDRNPLVILTPVFEDYERYVNDIEEENKILNENQSVGISVPPKPLATSFSFTGTSQTPGPSPYPLRLPNAGGFSFASDVKPFSFGSSVVAPPPEKEDNETDEPPTADFKPVVEENAVYSKRCKVFVKNAYEFADRGVGTLYIKNVPNLTKKQLIVRADTNLGKVLLNILISKVIPTQRIGKNNVMLVCIPTPDSANKKPVPVLLRVKTAADADELIDEIDKYKI